MKPKFSVGQVVTHRGLHRHYRRILARKKTTQGWQYKLEEIGYFYIFGDDECDIRQLNRREIGPRP